MVFFWVILDRHPCFDHTRHCSCDGSTFAKLQMKGVTVMKQQSLISGFRVMKHPWSSSRWWFQIFPMFTPIRGRFPFWLICFKGVETHCFSCFPFCMFRSSEFSSTSILAICSICSFPEINANPMQCDYNSKDVYFFEALKETSPSYKHRPIGLRKHNNPVSPSRNHHASFQQFPMVTLRQSLLKELKELKSKQARLVVKTWWWWG